MVKQLARINKRQQIWDETRPNEMNFESESKTQRELMLCGVYVENYRSDGPIGAVINPKDFI